MFLAQVLEISAESAPGKAWRRRKSEERITEDRNLL